MPGLMQLFQFLLLGHSNDSGTGNEDICWDDINKLYMAAEGGNDTAIKELISSGMDVDSRYNTSDVTPLYLAAANSHNSTLILLLDHRANIEAEVETRVGTLHLLSFAVYKNNTIAVKNLLDNGAEVNRTSRTVNILDIHWTDSININGLDLNPVPIYSYWEDDRCMKNINFKYLALKPLSIAAYCCSEDMVELLVNRGSSIDETEDEMSPLVIATVKRCEKVALKLLNLGATTKLITAVGWLPLHWAVLQKMEEVVQYLSKTDLLNDRDAIGYTPLHLAVHICRLNLEISLNQRAVDKIFKILLDHGADVNAKDYYGGTPLHKVSSPEITKLLLERGADVKAKDIAGKTPLHSAVVVYRYYSSTLLNLGAVDDCANISKILLDHGADVNAKDYYGDTPLHEVTLPETVKVLLERGADVNAQNTIGETPLHAYIKWCIPDTVKLLLMHNASMDITCDPIISFSNKFMVYQKFLKIVLHKQTRNNSTPISGYTPMAWGAHYGNIEILSLLIERNKSMLNPENYEWPPLHVVVCLRELDDRKLKLKFLIDSGADVNIKDSYSLTTLHKAIMVHDRYAVSALIGLKADVNARDINGWTPFHAAVYNQNNDIAQVLIKAGCDVNIADISGFTSLMWSIMGYRPYFFKLMIEKTLELSSTKRYHYFSEMIEIPRYQIDLWLSAIHKDGEPGSILDLDHVFHDFLKDSFEYIIQNDVEQFVDNTNNHINMVTWIADKTADLDMQDQIMGWTALHWASASGDFDVVKFLVEKGAYMNTKSLLGHTPMFLARYWGQKGIYEYLKQHGAVW